MRRGVLIRRVILVTCSLMFLAIVLGCMSLSIGGRQGGSSCEEGVSEQSGEVRVSAGRELDVYYPVPFASPPNLTLADDCDHVVQVEGRPDNFDCVLLEQQSDHFRVKNVGKFSGVLTWKARGLKAVAPPTVVAVPTVSSPASSSPAGSTARP